MFNKKRLFIFIVFMLFMFFMMTFASGTPQNQAIITRTVTFIDGFDNSEYDVQKVEVGTDAKVPKDPYHYGHVFAGWYELENEKVRVKDFTNILEDLSVIAKYEGDTNHNGIADVNEDRFIVTFRDTISNSVIKTQKVLEGLSATAPNAPKHSGYSFTGWSRSYTKVTANITVNTVYTKSAANVNMFSVTFIDGDTNNTISKVSVSEGKTATTPVAPKHENRVFDHWEGNYTNVTKNEIVTALYLDDINSNDIPDEKELKYAVYYHEGIANKGNVPVDSKRYLTKLKYTVLDNDSLSLDKAVFLGWSLDERTLVTDADGEKDIISAGYVGTINDSNVNYYAVFAEDKNNNNIPDYKENHYTVEFKANEHGTLTGTTKYENILVDLTFDEAGIVVPTTVADQYYIFNEWTPVFAEKVTGNIIYYASFKAENDENENGTADEEEDHYTIKFVVNGKGSLNGTTEYTNVLKDLTYEKAGVVVPTTVANQYYEFKNWTPSVPSETTVATSANDGDVITWTANFKPIKDENENGTADEEEDHYTIKFVVNGKGSLNGTTEYTNVLKDLTYKKAGVVVPTPVANQYYEFKNWTPSVPSETTVATSANDGDVITWTANFKPINDENENGTADEEEDHYTIKFVVNGKGSLNGTTEYTNVLKDLTYKKAGVVVPTPVANQYYEFKNWAPSVPSETTVATSDNDGDVITWTANFKPIKDENENGTADEEEDHYTVKFTTDRFGTLTGTTEFTNILTGLSFTKAGVSLPTVTVIDDNYEFDKWTPITPDGNTVVDSNKIYNATYKLNSNKKLTLDVSSINQTATVYDDDTTVKNSILATVSVTEEFDATYNVVIENFDSVDLNTAGGVYTLTIKVTDSLGNVDSKDITLTILKRKAIVSIDDKSSVYGSEIKELTYTITGEIASHPIGVSLSTTATLTSDVSDYPITGEYTNNNYDVEFENGKYSITQKEIVLDWDNTTFTYDKTLHKPAATIASGVINSDTVNVTVNGEQINAGTHTATAVIDNGNYSIKNPNKDFVINPQEVPVVWNNTEFTYDKTSHKPTATVTIDGNVIDLEVSGAAVNAGTHEATADYKASEVNNNYKLTNNKENFIINKAIPEYTVPTGLKAVEKDLLGSVVLPSGFTYESNTNTKLPAGIYNTTVKFTPEDTNNYLEVSGIAITIDVEELYDIRFISDGSVVATRESTINKTITPPANPTKDKTQQYTYTFAGWYVSGDTTQTLVTSFVVTGDTDYIAKYDKTVNKYTVEFQDYYGNKVGDIQTVEYGSAAIAPTVPKEIKVNSSAGVDSYLFEFNGWSTEEYKNVKGNLVVRALYSVVSTVETNVYVLKDGVNRPTTDAGLDASNYTKELESVSLKIKDNATVQERMQNAINEAKRTGVAQEIIIASEVTSSAVVENYLTEETLNKIKNDSGCTGDGYYVDWYVLKFRTDDGWHLDGEKVYTKYDITWKNYDGSILKTASVKKNVVPTYSGTPTKPSDAAGKYEFAGWDKTVVAATEDATYTATFRLVTYVPSFALSKSNSFSKTLNIVSNADISKIEYTYDDNKSATLSFTKSENNYSGSNNNIRRIETVTITYDDNSKVKYSYNNFNNTFTKE